MESVKRQASVRRRLTPGWKSGNTENGIANAIAANNGMRNISFVDFHEFKGIAWVYCRNNNHITFCGKK